VNTGVSRGDFVKPATGVCNFMKFHEITAAVISPADFDIGIPSGLLCMVMHNTIVQYLPGMHASWNRVFGMYRQAPMTQTMGHRRFWEPV
jgi:hypothetical protein